MSLRFSPFPQTQVIPVGVPVGAVIPYAGPIDEEDPTQAPALRQMLAAQGWLVCDGSLVPISQFPALAALLGNAYGDQEDGQFRLPDYRGVFLRGVNGTRQPPNDPDAGNRTASGPGGTGNTGEKVGSLQMSQFQEHEHRYAPGTKPSLFQTGEEPGLTATVQSSTTTAVVCTPQNESPPCFGAETRPLNIYVYFLIKASEDLLTIALSTQVGGLTLRKGRLISHTGCPSLTCRSAVYLPESPESDAGKPTLLTSLPSCERFEVRKTPYVSKPQGSSPGSAGEAVEV